ncbi:hypothetical protein [Sphaerisporangium sp. NPDC051011]|uniref:hypothetical protein n=1 Tax=Sphaerisporangium sp. NPDC051011 TaxID=3155792 RepID=UPI0033C8669D
MASPHEDEPAAGLSPLAPLCGAAEFDVLVRDMVVEEAPRVFAVVQEYGRRADGRIAAWGMAFREQTQVICTEDGACMILDSPERAVHRFSRRPDVTVRLLWLPFNRTGGVALHEGSADPQS